MEESGYGRYSWFVLASALLMALSLNLTLFSPGPILDSIRQGLQTSFAQIGLVFTVPCVIVAALSLIGGYLADAKGIRRVAGTGAVVLGVGSLLRALAQDFLTFLLFTAFFAVGLGLVLPNLPKAIRGWFPQSAVATASGIYVMGFPLGATIASGLTPYLAGLTRGWQGAFVGWGLLALVFAAVWWGIVREPKRRDVGSAGTSGFSMALLRRPALWIVAVMFFVNSSVYSIFVAWFPTLLVERGVQVQLAGLMVSTLTLANMAAAFSVPIFSDRLGLRRPFIWGFSAISAVTLVSLITAPTGFAWTILPILGVAAAGPFTMGFILPTELFDYKSLGSASGIVLSIGWLGIAYGTLLAGFLRDVSGNFYTTLVVLIVSSVIILVIGFVLPETGRRGKSAGDG